MHKILKVFFLFQFLQLTLTVTDYPGRIPPLTEIIKDFDGYHATKYPSIQGRIIGGYPVKAGHHPYQLWWSWRGKYKCGATLLEVYGIQIALTATHCMWLGTPHQDSVYAPSGVVVTAGDLILNDTDGREQTRQAKKIVAHGSFDPKYFTNDIAIIFLESDFVLNEWVDTAVLPGYNWDIPDYQVIVTGWGSYAVGGKLTDHLQKISIAVLDHDICTQYNAVGVKITDNVFCVIELGLDRWFGSCMGDSGGPAIAYNESLKEYYLCGVISYQMVTACGSPWYPHVYTRVAKYTDWIRIEVSKFIEEQRTK